ncbi:lysozyme inhibitor LprI family protein [uncultured Pantoea sp.]|uniref:lysozyme inhibitor LprI family protein n=1 Tax=uncultured Pantoea sp. TaxID=218084 RepID=UPI002803C7FB|nr:lysozyme inhibitor LprI family protein [uncultured Pantoea sp.]
MKKLIIAALIAFPVSQALAVDCENAEKQLDMNQCANTEYKVADKELNQTYQKALKATSGEQKSLLQSSQRKWIEFRDADCKFQTFISKGGSINSMNLSNCLLDKTKQRTDEFKKMLDCPEGDISCPL